MQKLSLKHFFQRHIILSHFDHFNNYCRRSPYWQRI